MYAAPASSRCDTARPIAMHRQCSTLERLPWFSFTALMSPGQDDAAVFCADAVERQYTRLARRYRMRPSLTLLVLDAHDWQRYAAQAQARNAHHAGGSTIIVPAECARRPRDAERAVADLVLRVFALAAATGRLAA
jgi:hypothetical protein